MKVYIDFDDVLCETGRCFSVIAKDLFNKDVPYTEVQFFNLQKTFDLNDDEYEQLMAFGHKPETLLAYEETPKASYFINKWVDEGHDIKVITGRPFDAYEPSRKWLDNHNLKRVPLICVDKYGREKFYDNASFNMTLKQLYEMEFDFAIEDSPAAFEHVMHFDNCTVAIFDRPWNSAVSFPNDNFVRCNDWEEINRLFEAIQNIL